MCAITSIIIYFNDLRRSIENTSMLAKKHSFTCCPTTKHQNAANPGLQTYEKKPGDCTVIDFSSLNNFTNWGSFAKVSVPAKTIIPWLYQRIIDMNRNGNLCKRTCVSKVIAETKVDARAEQQKQFTDFSRMSVMANLLSFGCLAAG